MEKDYVETVYAHADYATIDEVPFPVKTKAGYKYKPGLPGMLAICRLQVGGDLAAAVILLRLKWRWGQKKKLKRFDKEWVAKSRAFVFAINGKALLVLAALLELFRIAQFEQSIDSGFRLPVGGEQEAHRVGPFLDEDLALTSGKADAENLPWVVVLHGTDCGSTRQRLGSASDGGG